MSFFVEISRKKSIYVNISGKKSIMLKFLEKSQFYDKISWKNVCQNF